MTEPNRVHFPTATLLRDGEGIVTAAEAHAELAPRLPEGFLAETRTLLKQVAADTTGQKGKRADAGTLTTAQNTKLKALQTWMGKARYTAGLAFRGQDVKLHEEFQVGVNGPHDLGAILQRADIILAALKKPDNAAALKLKGWLDSDTEAFATMRGALSATAQTQKTAKGGAKNATGQRIRDANGLYDHLLTIQNAADLQWPAEDPANTGVRDEFRLTTFPPRGGAAAPEPPAPPPTPPPAK